MYATTPRQHSPPTCSTTTTKHLYPLPLTISSFTFADICSGKNSFNHLCTDDIIDSHDSKHNFLNNNNNDDKILNGDSLDPACLSSNNDPCNRSIYDYLNNQEKLNASLSIDMIDSTLLKDNQKKSQELTTKRTKFKLGKPRQFVKIDTGSLLFLLSHCLFCGGKTFLLSYFTFCFQ